MKIIVQAGANRTSIEQSLGAPEYSYAFVQSAFLPVLRGLGNVVSVAGPDQVDIVYDAAQAVGEACVFLCFTPPHLVPAGLRCPTIPVFAWEFTTIPCESFGGDERDDWRVTFAAYGRAITLSRETARLVRDAMGQDFPVFAIPAPNYDRFALIEPAARPRGPREINLRGHVFDTAGDGRFLVSRPAPARQPPRRRFARETLSFTVQAGVRWYRDSLRSLLPPPVKAGVSFAGRTLYRVYSRAMTLAPKSPVSRAEPPAPPPLPLAAARVTVSGVVYTAVLSPLDGRKNWTDLVSGFVWALRDRPDATLIVKMPRRDASGFQEQFDGWLTQLAPFQCRVVAIYGFLEDAEYDALIEATDYYVNSSSAEGLCLPLLEFLSAGRPALAPAHSAMADYITPCNAYVLGSTLEHNVWPHDPRELYRTMRHRLNWRSLADAYEQSFARATALTNEYDAMARRAKASMAEFCAAEIVRAQLAAALAPIAAPARVAALGAAG
jgi:glycosyltransferase involved in cell wall biosynthesis